MKQTATPLTLLERDFERIEELGDNHASLNLETPLREDAFEMNDADKIKKIAHHFSEIMHTMGLDLSDDSLSGTPLRVAKMYVTELFAGLRDIASENKKAFGAALNQLRSAIEAQIDAKKEFFEDEELNAKLSSQKIDITEPFRREKQGFAHPISKVIKEIREIFGSLGFDFAEGPEIEEDFFNFTALNMPKNHPARQMQDTFYLQGQDENDGEKLLRTHTSNVQIRLMENSKPPIRSIMPGRVYRNEAISARSHCYIQQVEALYVDKNVSFKDLKDTLYHFAKEMFGSQTKVSYRPSYFPFTEPSAEIDISCLICKGNGCNVCKHSGWVEIAGSGMVDPAVLENAGIDSQVYSGFAFGMGIERVTMLKYQVNDLRLFTENDIRFLRQFQGA